MQVSLRRLPASPDRLDAEMRSLRFLLDSFVKTVTDELRTVHDAIKEVQLDVKRSDVSVAFSSFKCCTFPGSCTICPIHVLAGWHRRHLNQGYRFVLIASLCESIFCLVLCLCVYVCVGSLLFCLAVCVVCLFALLRLFLWLSVSVQVIAWKLILRMIGSVLRRT